MINDVCSRDLVDGGRFELALTVAKVRPTIRVLMMLVEIGDFFSVGAWFTRSEMPSACSSGRSRKSPQSKRSRQAESTARLHLTIS